MSGSTIHPDMQAIIDASARTTDQLGPRGDDVAATRKWWTVYTEALSRPHPDDMQVHDQSIPTEQRDVPVRVYRPGGSDGARPGIIYLHGGGFMLGDLDSSDSNAWGFAQETGAVVVSVDYRLTPEHPYPAAFDDCYGVLTWLAQQGREVGIDSGRIAVAGDSAGGSLGAAMCLAARDRGGPQMVAQALIYPSTGTDQDSGSYVEHADGPGLTTASTRKYRDLYLPGAAGIDDPYARPVKAQDHSNLPPAWVHSAEIDPIRDDGRVYAAKLALAGTWVTYREARGMIHGFLRARFAGPAARAEFDAICGFLRERLGSAG
jgi:acetyl esterase